MRKLSDEFMNDLKNGILSEILRFVLNDNTLELMIREEYINIYYRGGNLLKIEKKISGEYNFSFNKKYLKYNTNQELPDNKVSSKNDVKKWIEILPCLKQNIDYYNTNINAKLEREYQQLIVKESNELTISNSSEIFITDIEYNNKFGRFDLIGIEWDRSKSTLPKGYKPKLLLMEMKFGDGALKDSIKKDGKKADIKQHLIDVDKFLDNKENIETLKNETISILKQKKELGFFRSIQHNKNQILDLNTENIDFILLLGGHNPRSTILKEVFDSIEKPKNFNLKIGTANFIGYGLFKESIYTINEFKSKFKKQIFCK